MTTPNNRPVCCRCTHFSRNDGPPSDPKFFCYCLLLRVDPWDRCGQFEAEVIHQPAAPGGSHA